MSSYEFHLSLRVYDTKQLLAAALAHPDAEGMTVADFSLDDGFVDVPACLCMLLDPGALPGCSVNTSSAEAI